jgi:DNA-binding response OmpR family regulator
MADQRRNVLLIDNDTSSAIERSAALRSEGFDVELATDARSALEAIASGNYGFVVAELQLADMSVFELMRKVATLTAARRPSFILLVTEVSIDLALRAMRLGAVDVLQLPVPPTEIADAIRRVEARPSKLLQPKPLDPLQATKLLLMARDKRDMLFGQRGSDDATWQILTELYLAHASATPMALSDVLHASGTPYSSAVRRLAELVDDQILVRTPDQNDHRRVLVSLTPPALDKMHEFYKWFGEMASRMRSGDEIPRTTDRPPYRAIRRRLG